MILKAEWQSGYAADCNSTSVRFRSQPPYYESFNHRIIRFHRFFTFRKLINMGWKVYGIDNMNNYYDVELKKARLSILNKSNSFHFEEEDITNILSCYHDTDLI